MRAAGVPVAVVGSIALALTATPVQAQERAAEERAPRVIPWRTPAQQAPAHAVTAKAPAAASVASAVLPATKRPSTYTVRRGDTVSAIASRFGLRTVDVLAINGLSWKSVIYPGQVLRLTGGGKAAASSPSSSSAPKASSGGSYKVKAGDTISSIAQRHGVSIKAVLNANRLGWSSIIYPGQKLTIPGSGGVSDAVPASSSTPVRVAASSGGKHVVKAGDTISAIAQRHGLTTKAVLAANGLGASSIIYPGQKLTIPAGSSGSGGSTQGLDGEQIANAKLIIQVGRDLGVPDRGIAIALGTAMQESWIRNLDWGDRDSLGLFQQRPSAGWGTPKQIRDKVRAIKVFYGGASDPNGPHTRGLLDIPGWSKMSFAAAAQAVQISAYPDRYAKWEKPAYAWLAALG